MILPIESTSELSEKRLKDALYQLSYAPCEFSIRDCSPRIANGREHRHPHRAARRILRLNMASQGYHLQFRQKPKPDGDLGSRHPACVPFFERAKLRSSAKKTPLFSLLSPDRDRQIRCSRTSIWISNSSACDLSFVIYVFCGFQMCRIVAF